jgi:hypothetical protein
LEAYFEALLRTRKFDHQSYTGRLLSSVFCFVACVFPGDVPPCGPREFALLGATMLDHLKANNRAWAESEPLFSTLTTVERI